MCMCLCLCVYVCVRVCVYYFYYSHTRIARSGGTGVDRSSGAVVRRFLPRYANMYTLQALQSVRGRRIKY